MALGMGSVGSVSRLPGWEEARTKSCLVLLVSPMLLFPERARNGPRNASCTRVQFLSPASHNSFGTPSGGGYNSMTSVRIRKLAKSGSRPGIPEGALEICGRVVRV